MTRVERGSDMVLVLPSVPVTVMYSSDEAGDVRHFNGRVIYGNKPVTEVLIKGVSVIEHVAHTGHI